MIAPSPAITVVVLCATADCLRLVRLLSVWKTVRFSFLPFPFSMDSLVRVFFSSSFKFAHLTFGGLFLAWFCRPARHHKPMMREGGEGGRADRQKSHLPRILNVGVVFLEAEHGPGCWPRDVSVWFCFWGNLKLYEWNRCRAVNLPERFIETIKSLCVACYKCRNNKYRFFCG